MFVFIIVSKAAVSVVKPAKYRISRWSETNLPVIFDTCVNVYLWASQFAYGSSVDSIAKEM